MTHHNSDYLDGQGQEMLPAGASVTQCQRPKDPLWFRLVASGPAGGFAARVLETAACAHGALPAIGPVLLEVMPGLLDMLGPG